MAFFKKEKEEKKPTQKVVAEDKKKVEKKADKKSASVSSAKKADTKEEKKVKEEKIKTGRAYDVLVRPLITEKGSSVNSEGKYLFEVGVDSNKIEIAKAVKEVYGVNPISVNVINTKGKKVRFGRNFGKRKDWKKAIVTLPKGESINVYEGV